MFKQGDIIIIPILFTDLTSTKKRPAIVISRNEYNNITDDIIVMAITSNISMKEYCINLNSKDLISGFLLADSQIRADKIYSISKTIVIKKLGSVKNYIIDSIKNCITNLFDVSHQPSARNYKP